MESRHKDHFSDDAFGNMQRWFSTLTETYLVMLDRWRRNSECTENKDNINSMVARIMLKLAKLEEAGMIGGEDVAKLQSALRAISPIAKMMKVPNELQQNMLIVSELTQAEKAKQKATARTARSERCT